MDGSVSEKLRNVKERIACAAERSGRRAEDVTMVAVSKQMPPERMLVAYEAGVRVFGENHAQELRDKYPLMPPDCKWHFIGGLQSNKAKYLIGKTELVQSVDSLKLAKLLDRLSAQEGKGTGVLIQINLAREAQKGGIPASEAESLIGEMRLFEHIRLKGLMTIPPISLDEEGSRAYFKEMRALFERLRLTFAGDEQADFSVLSMGMSADFETAIEEGSNMVRVGSAIFGPRKN